MPSYKILLEPEEDCIDGIHLDVLLEMWLQHCFTKAEPYTVACYRDKLAHFRRWWSSVGPNYNWQVTRKVFVDFEMALRDFVKPSGDALSYNTRNDVIRRLRSALKWAFETNRLPVNCRGWIPAASGEPPKRTVMGLAQLEHLMECAGQSLHPERDQALFAFLVGVGLRRIECVRLNIEHVVFFSDGTGLAKVTGKRTRANRTGEREVALDVATTPYVALHIVELGRNSGPLFCSSKTGERLTAQGIYKAVKSVVRRAGLDKQMQACHDLRRAFTTHFVRLRPGAAYADMLRRQLGHKYYSQTADYNLMSADDLRAHIVSPLAALKATKNPHQKGAGDN